MRLIRTEESAAIFKAFGYIDSNNAPAKLMLPNRGGVRFAVPLYSMRQAAISENVIGAIVSREACGQSTSAIVHLTDWAIYYEYELRMFWKIMGHDLIGGRYPEFAAIYWTRLEDGDVDKIKSAFFLMMAFEFSGCVLFNSPDAGIFVNDGEVAAASADEGVRNALLQAEKDSSA